MNLLLFNRDQVSPGGLLTVSGGRAEHLLRVLKVVPGGSVRVGEIGGDVGAAEVVEVSAERGTSGQQVIVRIGTLAPGAIQPGRVKLIIALPRPQILKKVLQAAAMFGVEEVVFTGGARVEPSYWSSKMVRPDSIEEHLLLGMEQGEVTRMPRVSFVNRLAAVTGSFSGGSIETRLLLYADRGGSDLIKIAGVRCAKNDRIDPVVAIGPEGGWIDTERQAFDAAGFSRLGLGEFNLRVDVAVAAVLSQVNLLGFDRAG